MMSSSHEDALLTTMGNNSAALFPITVIVISFPRTSGVLLLAIGLLANITY